RGNPRRLPGGRGSSCTLRKPGDGERAQGGALGEAVGDQIFLRAVDLAAANAHRVDHRHSASGDVVAVADTAGWLPGDRLAKVRAGLLAEAQQRLAFLAPRLAPRAEAGVGSS